MAYNYEYPYTDPSRSNADWLLHRIIELGKQLEDFTNINTIKYHDPIEWDITTQYEQNYIVTDNDIAYLSKQPVPRGVNISNTDYWLNIGNFGAQSDYIRSSIALENQKNNITSSKNIEEGTYVWWKGSLYIASRDITTGEALVENLNLSYITIEEKIKENENKIALEIANVNTRITNVNSRIDALPNDFIRPQDFGAVGDGITDDTQAFIDMCNDNSKAIYIPAGSYLITNSIPLKSNTTIYANSKALIIDDISPSAVFKTYPAVFKTESKNNILIDGVNIEGKNKSISQGGGIDRITIDFNKCKNVTLRDINITWSDTNYAIRMKECEDCIVDNVYINHYHYIGVAFSIPCKNCKLVNSTILNGDNLAYNQHGQKYPIDANGFEESLSAGALMNDGIVIDGNYVFDTYGTWEGLDAHGGNNLVITNNIFKNVYCGIVVNSSTPLNYKVTNAVISNNLIELTQDNLLGDVKNNCGIVANGTNMIVSNNIIKYGGHAGSLLSAFDDPCAFLITDVCQNMEIFGNLFFECRANIFELKGNPKQVHIHDNYIDYLYWAAPYGSLKACVFNIHNVQSANHIIIDNNNINRYEANDWLIYGKTGDAVAAYGVNDPYIKIVNNTPQTSRNLINQYADNIITDMSNVANLKMGKVGDMIFNTDSQANNAMWVCTKKWSFGAGGIWKAI